MSGPYLGAVGPLVVRLEGGGPERAVLERELAPLTAGASQDRAPDTVIRLVPTGEVRKLFRPKVSSAKHHMGFDDRTYFWDRPVPHLVEGLFGDGRATVTIGTSAPTPLRRAKAALSGHMNASPVASYSLLWYLMAVRLLRAGTVFVHAGVVSRGGRARLFTGTGGSGKTSLAFELLRREGYAYLAEDFAMLGPGGTVHPSPKTLSVYDSDVRTGGDLYGRALDHRTPLQAAVWAAQRARGRNPMIKVPVAAALPAGKLGQSSALEHAVHVVRCDAESPRVEEVDPRELAASAVRASMRELKHLVELLYLVGANKEPVWGYPSVADLEVAMLDVWVRALEGARTLRLYAPFRATPAELVAPLEPFGV